MSTWARSAVVLSSLATLNVQFSENRIHLLKCANKMNATKLLDASKCWSNYLNDFYVV